ncbi:MAG: hypothetical protein PHF97_06420 [Bacteroidales bacterium]|nr:hypothetical protein [Bacteroidales bacterium]
MDLKGLFGNVGFMSGGILNLTPKQAFALCKQGAVIIDVREEALGRFKMFGVAEVLYCPFSILEETYEQFRRISP